MSREEAQLKEDARLAAIREGLRRKKEHEIKKSLELSETIADTRRTELRDTRVSNQGHTVKPSSLVNRIAKEHETAAAELEERNNPRVRMGQANGIPAELAGKTRLRDVREHRPDIFEEPQVKYDAKQALLDSIAKVSE